MRHAKLLFQWIPMMEIWSDNKLSKADAENIKVLRKKSDIDRIR
jgi:hypothetical protein